MKSYIQKYFKDIRYPIAVYLSIFSIAILRFRLIPLDKLAHLFKEDRLEMLRDMGYTLLSIMLIILLPAFLYQIYRKEWKEALFLLLISIFIPVIIIALVGIGVMSSHSSINGL